MKILAVDDEYIGLMALTDALRKAAPGAEIVDFSDPDDAYEYVSANNIDIAFLDIFMESMTGIDLAKKIKELRPNVHIVFQTGYDEYMKDAFGLHARGYVLKPVTKQKILAELENITPLISPGNGNDTNQKRIRFQCFGNFEVFADNVPLHFKYEKTKEMLAYIVSRRGALCSNNEIIINLWEDDTNHESYLRGLRKDLIDQFREKGLEEVFFQQRGKIAVNPDMVSCDYYDFLDGDINTINKYNGEFMSQFSWAELLNAGILSEKEK